MIEINLVPDVKQELLRAQHTRAVVISSSIITSIVAVGIVVLILLYMGTQVVRGRVADDNISKKGEQFASIEDLSKILTIQNQLSAINSLNGKKHMDSRMFDMISAITPRDTAVSFTRMSLETPDESLDAAAATGATGGQIHLEGQTVGYDAMEVFKKTIENTVFQYTVDGENATLPIATQISTGDISYGEDVDGNRVLRFTVSFEYPAELFAPTSKDIVFKLNVNGNVTDSYLGIPRFTERAKDIREEQ